MPVRPTQEQLTVLLRLGAATVYEAQGQTGAMDSGIKPIFRGARLVGPALTVDGAPGDNLIIHYALTQGQPGDILVADVKGFRETGHIGDLMGFGGKCAGFAGMLIDGTVRDATFLDELQFPVFARGLSIKAPSKNQPGRINVPIICGGVLVNPGDIILGDEDGVVCVIADNLADVIRKAEERESRENGVREQLAKGGSTFALGQLEERARRLGII